MTLAWSPAGVNWGFVKSQPLAEKTCAGLCLSEGFAPEMAVEGVLSAGDRSVYVLTEVVASHLPLGTNSEPWDVDHETGITLPHLPSLCAHLLFFSLTCCSEDAEGC